MRKASILTDVQFFHVFVCGGDSSKPCNFVLPARSEGAPNRVHLAANIAVLKFELPLPCFLLMLLDEEGA